MNFSDLKFVRLRNDDPSLMMFDMIPNELFEQVKGRSFEIDQLKKLAPNLLSDPTQLFYILIDGENKIKGVFWASANVLNNCIDFSILSIDKEYQFSDAIKKTLEFIDTFQKNATVRIITTRTAAYEKAGFKKIKTMMEIKES